MASADSTDNDITGTLEDLRQSRRNALEKLSNDELVELVLQLETGAEDTLQMRRPMGTRTFDLPWEPREFIRLPEKPDHPDASVSRRVSLVSFDLTHPTIGLVPCGDIVIGRGPESDLDLTDYNAFEYGVSRRHAMLRVVDDGFQLVDLNSSNGTSCNSKRLEPEVPHRLRHNDIIDFGSLRFQFRVID